MKPLQCFLLLCIAAIALGQPRKKEGAHSALYVEFIGNAIGISANYDHLFNENLSIRWGLGGYWCGCDYAVSPPIDTTGEYVNYDPSTATGVILLMANFLSSGSSHRLEFGAGIIYALESYVMPGNEGKHLAGTLTIGYRLQPPDGGFLFRIGFTPLLSSSGIALSGGISIGGAF